jgi:hypothetical protein
MRRWAAVYLGQFGLVARTAIPMRQKLEQNEAGEGLAAVSEALKRIASEEAE